jgi:hypothetical protein
LAGTLATTNGGTGLGGATPFTSGGAVYATSTSALTTGTLPTTAGGTGLSTFTAGDLPYYASGTALSKLGIGLNGQILTSTGSAPQWSTLSGVAVTTFSAGTTGFTPSSATSGAITLAGTLATTNGGTGLGGATPFTANGVVYASSTSALATGSSLTFNGTTLTANTLNLTNALVTTYGGTGLTTFTAGDLPYYASGTALSKLGIGTAGQILTSTGAAPQWSTLSGVAVTTFSAGTTGFTPSSATSGAVTLAGTLATTNGGTGLGGATPFTANGVVYASSTSALATGSALVFDGTNLGLGVTPSAWLSSRKVFQVGLGGSIAGVTNYFTELRSNSYLDSSGVERYISSNAASYHYLGGGTHVWFNAPVGTAGNPVTFTQAMTLDTTGNLGIGTSSPVNKLVVSNAGAAGFEVNPADPSGVALASYNRSGAAYANSIYYASNQIFCAGGTTEGMRLDSSGNLGIGTGSPDVKLTVLVADNTIGVKFKAATSNIRFIPQDSGAAKIAALNAAESAFYPLIMQGSNLQWVIDTTERMRLDASGNLGLGVTPSAWNAGSPVIQMAGGTSIYADPNQTIYGLNAAFISGFKYVVSDFASQYIQVNGQHQWFIAPSGTAGNAITFTQAMTLDASGNLGIGTTSPVNYTNYKTITLQGAATTSGGVFQSQTSDASFTANFYVDNSGVTFGSTTANSPLKFLTGNTERMRIDASGNLLVGTTTYAGGANVAGFGANPVGQIAVERDGGIAGVFNRFSSDGQLIIFRRQGATVGDISVSTLGTTFNTISDYRLKTVIGAVADSGSRIDALQPVEYTWNSSGERTRGFLAHQFQEVYAGSVSGTKDAVDSEGKPVYQAMQASTAEVIADLVAEIQSLRIRITQLENKL